MTRLASLSSPPCKVGEVAIDSLVVDRLLILQAGHCFCKFSDGVAIWVGDAALDCIVIDRQGSQLSYVPRFAPQSRFNVRRRLQMLFAIRNQFHPIPVAVVNLATPDSGLVSDRVRWPERPVAFLCKRISEHEAIVHSCCRHYSLRIVVQNIHLSFPIAVDKGSIVVEQICPIENCPDAWLHARQLAVQTQQQCPLLHSARELLIDMSLPRSQSRLPRTQTNASLIAIDSALPDHDAVAVEWTPEAVWHVVDEGAAISVTFAADSSVLRSSDLKFFEHTSPWTPPVLFSVEHAGEMDFASSPLPIVSAMHRACRLLLHYRSQRVPAPSQVQRLECSAPVLSCVSHYSCSVPGVGEFTGFQDGRVSVRFFDRTIAQLDPVQKRLNIVTRDGCEVGLSIPWLDLRVDLVPYARVCVEFANWSNMSPEERVERQRETLERNELVQKLLQSSSDFLNSR